MASSSCQTEPDCPTADVFRGAVHPPVLNTSDIPSTNKSRVVAGASVGRLVTCTREPIVNARQSVRLTVACFHPGVYL